MNPVERNKDLIRRFVEAGNARDLGALDALVSPRFERRCPATPDVEVHSLEDFRRYLTDGDWAVCPDSHVTLHELIAEGDLVAFWATYAGTQEGQMGPFPPSGKRMSVEFGGHFRIEDDKIASLVLTWDNVSALAQLGHFPPQAADSARAPDSP